MVATLRAAATVAHPTIKTGRHYHRMPPLDVQAVGGPQAFRFDNKGKG